MTAIAHADKILSGDASDSKLHIQQDVFVGRTYGYTGGGVYGTVARLHQRSDRLELVWRRALFITDGYYGGDVQGREVALTQDGQFLYAIGANLTPGTDNFYKLNSADGTTVWSKESTYPFYKLAVDNLDDAIIWEEHGEPTAGNLMKYTSAGVKVWSISLNDVTAIATDSQRNIYVTHSPEVGGYSLRKYDPDGNFVWGAAIHSGASHGNDVAVNKDDDIFVAGSASGTPGSYHSIYKYSPASSALVDSEPVGSGATNAAAYCVVCDSKGNVIAGGAGTVDKLNSSLTSQWYGDYSGGQNVQLATDFQNRVHIFSAKYEGQWGGYMIRDEDDNFVHHSGQYLWNIYGAVMAREVFLTHYTDQSVNLFREDMCCFQDDTIPEFVEGPDPGTWNEGDECFSDWLFGYSFREHVVGFFKSLVDNNDGMLPGENELAWQTDSLVPACGNADWNAFDGFGGIGSAPQIYTISITGMKNVSDPTEDSPYNGEFLLIRGPGTFGFFFGVQHDAQTRIHFEVETTKDTAGNESLQFGTDTQVSSIFNYSGASAHTGKWLDLANSNVEATEDAIAFTGTASLYPGKIARWDAVTVWAADVIVAWKGSFYQANSPNVNSEPPSAVWTIIS